MQKVYKESNNYDIVQEFELIHEKTNANEEKEVELEISKKRKFQDEESDIEEPQKIDEEIWDFQDFFSFK